MHKRRFVIMLFIMKTVIIGMIPTAAQDAEPTTVTEYDPTCAVDLMKVYMSGWEYDHRGSEGAIDVVVAAQVARGVYKSVADAKVDCKDTIGGFKQNLLRSMHSDYPPEDLARMLGFVDEAVGSVEYNDCAYTTTT